MNFKRKDYGAQANQLLKEEILTICQLWILIDLDRYQNTSTNYK
jgi:hypothetical protein